MKKKQLKQMPTLTQLEAELKRTRYKKRYRSVLKSTVYTLITVAAIAVLVATLWLPVLQIFGSSMTPTLSDGEIVFSDANISFFSFDHINIGQQNHIHQQSIDYGRDGHLAAVEDKW